VGQGLRRLALAQAFADPRLRERQLAMLAMGEDGRRVCDDLDGDRLHRSRPIQLRAHQIAARSAGPSIGRPWAILNGRKRCKPERSRFAPTGTSLTDWVAGAYHPWHN